MFVAQSFKYHVHFMIMTEITIVDLSQGLSHNKAKQEPYVSMPKSKIIHRGTYPKVRQNMVAM